MALTKEQINDKYEIVGTSKHLQIREATIVKEDGVELSRNYHRRVLSPGDDVSSESQEIQDLTKAVWTDELIANYKKEQEDNA